MGAKLCKHGTVFSRCRCMCPDEVVLCRPGCPEYVETQDEIIERNELLISVAHALIRDVSVSNGIREQAFDILERQANRGS